MPVAQASRPGALWGGQNMDRSRLSLCITAISDIEEQIHDVKHGLKVSCRHRLSTVCHVRD